MQAAIGYKELSEQQQIMHDQLEITTTALLEKNNKGPR